MSYIEPKTEPGDVYIGSNKLSTHRLYEITLMLETRGWESYNTTWGFLFQKPYEGCGSVAHIHVTPQGDVSMSSHLPEDPTDQFHIETEPVGLEDFIYDALDIIRIWQRGQIIPDWGGNNETDEETHNGNP